MISTLTGEQFRYLWRAAGGDILTPPLQVVAGLRTLADARQRDRDLAQWWAECEDPRLFSAVRRSLWPRAWLASTAFDTGGRPHRGLLAVGVHRSTLVLQEPIRTCANGTWSRDGGGDCRVEDGSAHDLAAALVHALPDFSAGGVGPLRARLEDIEAGRDPLGDDVRFGGPVTVSAAERIRALAGDPRKCEGQFVLSVPEGRTGEVRPARMAWIVGRSGGHLFDGAGTAETRLAAGACGAGAVRAGGNRTGEVRVRPASRRDLLVAVRSLLADIG